MELNINSPSYYSMEFGVDDEVYWFCRKIAKFAKDKTYSEIIDKIGVMPGLVPKELLDKGLWKEVLKYDFKCNLVIISKNIDYEKYLSADMEGKKKLILSGLLEMLYKMRKKGQFDYERFKKDILEHLEYTEEDLENI